MADHIKKESKKRKRDVVLHQPSAATSTDVDLESQVQVQIGREEVAARKRGKPHIVELSTDDTNFSQDIDTSKPSAVFQPKKGRKWTVSLALPGSFIRNVRTYDAKASLACRIARAAAVFCVDEIVVFDDDPTNVDTADLNPSMKKELKKYKDKADWLSKVADEDEPWQNPDQFLFHLLTFLETPPHLRRPLFPQHPNMKGAGSFLSTDMPHHIRGNEWLPYREGYTLDPNEHQGPGFAPVNAKRVKRASRGPETPVTLVECGLSYPVKLYMDLQPYMRITLKFGTADPPPGFPHLEEHDIDSLPVEAVQPQVPREESGYYWGYTTRKAASLSDVYTECPFEDGYDVSIGTSERGTPLQDLLPTAQSASKSSGKSPRKMKLESAGQLPSKFKHLLIVFGGVAGLEPAVLNDPVFQEKGSKAKDVFDFWCNICPGQGSRTIRTEEAVWIALMGLKPYVEQHGSNDE